MPISLLNVVRHRTSSTVIGRLPLPNIRVTLLYDTYGVGGEREVSSTRKVVIKPTQEVKYIQSTYSHHFPSQSCLNFPPVMHLVVSHMFL